MSIREPNSIDIILERPPFETEDCKLILIIVDATSDLSDEDRLRLLIQKLAAYHVYVSSPDFAQKYPKLKASDVIVRVMTVMPPTIDMQMVDAIRAKDGSGRLRVFFDDYHAYMAKVRALKKSPPSSN